jgi:hypothetical protein
MPLTRRDLLGIAVLAPIGAVAGAVAVSAARLVRSAVDAARPSASGSSATRCARCGDLSHTMLDARCPMERRVVRDAA